MSSRLNIDGNGIKVGLVMDTPVYMAGTHSPESPNLFYAAEKVTEKPTCKVQFETINTSQGDVWLPFLENTREVKEGDFVTVLDLKRKHAGAKGKATQAKKKAKQ